MWNNFPRNWFIGDNINIMKKTFLFKFLFLKRFFRITSLQINKEKLIIGRFSWFPFLFMHPCFLKAWYQSKSKRKSSSLYWKKIAYLYQCILLSVYPTGSLLYALPHWSSLPCGGILYHWSIHFWGSKLTAGKQIFPSLGPVGGGIYYSFKVCFPFF